MMIPGGANINPAAAVARTYQPQSFPPAQSAAREEPREDLARRFDSVTISGSGAGNMGMELTSRLTQEVRTATSTDRIASLREQILSGEYRPDPMEIARRMLLMGGAV